LTGSISRIQGFPRTLRVWGSGPYTGRIQEGNFLFALEPLRTPLKNMTGFMIPSVKFLSIDAIRLAHADCQIGAGRFDHGAVAVIHEAVGMQANCAAS
jgi:hypothetical protein